MKLNKIHFACLIILLYGMSLACNAVTGLLESPTPTPIEVPEVVLTPATDVVETAVAEVPTVVVEIPTVEVVPIEPTPYPPLSEAIQHFDNISAAHEENPVYPDTGAPPPGGVHNPVWQNCGVYTEPIEARHAVHSMEHGAVWLAYNPELPENDVKILQELAKNQAYTIMSPYPGLRSPIIITGWGIQFETDSAADPRILEFLLTYQQGPQTPEPGAPCQGGIGLPRSPDSIGFS